MNRSAMTTPLGFVMLLVAALAIGCRKPQAVDMGDPVFYPAPPDPPRVQFLMSFSDADLWAPRRSTFAEMIVGEQKAPGWGAIKAPYGLACRDGKIYICDLGAHRVHVIDVLNKTYAILGAPGQIRNPVNITIDTDGTKYVSDTKIRRVVVFDAQDRFVRYLGDPENCAPSDLVISGEELIVTDIAGCQLEAWSRDGKFLRILVDKGKGPGQLSRPTNVAIGPKGRLFVTDTMASIINIYDREGRYTGSVGAPGDRPGYFFRPKGVAIDSAGILWAVDAAWEMVQAFDPEGNLLLFFGGANPEPHGLGMPAGVTIDRSTLPAFRKYLAKDFEPKYLFFVANQFGKNKIGVYAFGRSSTADYTPTTRPAATRPATQPATTRPGAKIESK